MARGERFLPPTTSRHLEAARTTGAPPPIQGYRTIRWPWAAQEAARLLTERHDAQARLSEFAKDSPEWFPAACPRGSALSGFTDPAWQRPRRGRRWRLKAPHAVCTGAPAVVMPERSGRGAAGDKAWGVRRCPVPWWALAAGLGRAARAWERCPPGVGRCRLVGTPVPTAAPGPHAVGAEAPPRGWTGQRVASAPPAGRAGRLGAAVSPAASPPDVQRAAGLVAHAAHPWAPADAPHPVHTDGWPAPHGAWKAWCPPLLVLWGVRPALLHRRDRATPAWAAVVAPGPERGVGGGPRAAPTPGVPPAAATAGRGHAGVAGGRAADPDPGRRQHPRPVASERC